MDRASRQGNRQLQWTMTCDEDDGESEINVSLCVPRSPSGERRNKKAMKIQQRSSGAGSASASPRPGAQEEDSELEGEFSPANSGVDPNFLRKIKKATDLSKSDQEVRDSENEDSKVNDPLIDCATDWPASVRCRPQDQR